MVADDHELVRRGLKSTLEAVDGWKVVAEAGDGRQALDEAMRTRPDVIVLDLGMPELNGLEVARSVSRESPNTRILVLTVYEAEHVVREVLDAGAHGYLLKSDAGRELVQAIQALLDDKPYFTSKIARMILNGYLRGEKQPVSSRSPYSILTGREREIVQLLAEGQSTKEVAARLGISVATVSTHRSKIMKKIGAHTIADVVRYAIRNEIVRN